jgi:hypothetical protein
MFGIGPRAFIERVAESEPGAGRKALKLYEVNARELRVWLDKPAAAPPAEQTAPAAPTSQRPGKKHSGARPVNYDWAGAEAALEEKCRREGIPSRNHSNPKWRTKTAVYQFLGDWFVSHGHADPGPADATLKDRVASMFARIEAKLNNAGN